ncbi:MAG: hypothetical protein P4L69_00065 [Desulfosporosinus sp.]|nr:hypothetical protein [Desulfosporosinus sp.]
MEKERKTIRDWLATEPREPDEALLEAIKTHTYVYKQADYDGIDPSSGKSLLPEGFLVVVKPNTAYPLGLRSGMIYTSGEYLIYKAVKSDGSVATAPIDGCLWVICDAKAACLASFEATKNPGAAKNLPAGAECYSSFRGLSDRYLKSVRGAGMRVARSRLVPATTEGLASLVGHAPIATATAVLKKKKEAPQPASRVEPEGDDWKAKYDALWRSMTGPQEDSFRMQQTINIKDTQIARQERRITELEEGAKEAAKAAQSRVEEATAIKNAEIRALPTKEVLEAKDKQIADLRTSLSVMVPRDDLKSKEATIASMEQNIKVIEAERDARPIQADLAKINAEKLHIQGELNVCQDKLSVQSKECAATIAQITKEHDVAEKEYNSYRTSTNTQMKDLESALTRTKLEAERNTLEAQRRERELYVDWEGRNEAITAEAQRLQQENAAGRAELERLRRELEEPRSAPTAALAQLQADVARLQQENAAGRVELERLRRELEESRSAPTAALAQLQADVSRLTKENEQIPKLTADVQRLTQALLRLRNEPVPRPTRSTDIDAILGGEEYI